MQTHYFGEKTWPELKEYAEQNALIILPVGEVEEHTRSLPVDTDSRIAKNLANEIADEIAGEIPVLVLPTVWAGYTPKAVGKWPGAMRVRPQVFTEYVHDICASIAEMGFTKLLMLDCHGQHGPMLNIVTKLIADEYAITMLWRAPSPSPATNSTPCANRRGADAATPANGRLRWICTTARSWCAPNCSPM